MARDGKPLSPSEEQALSNAQREFNEKQCERDGGHVYELTTAGIGPCTFCGKEPVAGDKGHVINRN